LGAISQGLVQKLYQRAGRITQDEYDKKAYELKQSQYDLDLKLKQYTEADEKFGITVNYLLNLASRAYELFESSKIEQKRQLINFLLSNLRLKGKTLLYDVNKPFDAILNANKCSDWLPLVDIFRTFYNSQILSLSCELKQILTSFDLACNTI